MKWELSSNVSFNKTIGGMIENMDSTSRAYVERNVTVMVDSLKKLPASVLSCSAKETAFS